MGRIDFCGGDKGGAGKSMLTKSMVYYFNQKKRPFSLFDADRINQDIKELFTAKSQSKVCSIVYNESVKFENSPNIVFNRALEGKDCIVNLPSQILESLWYWFDKNDIFYLAEQKDVKFRYWFISDGGYESTNIIFSKYLKYFGSKFETLFVKNLGKSEDWSYFDGDKNLQKEIKKYGVKIVEFPKFFGERERNTIDAKMLTFDEAYQHYNSDIISQNKVGSFLRKTETMFDPVFKFEESKDLELVGTVSEDKQNEQVKIS